MVLIELLDELVGLLDFLGLSLAVSEAGAVSLLTLVLLLELADEEVSSLLAVSALLILLELSDEKVTSLLTVSLANSSSIARAEAEATLVCEAIEATIALVVAARVSAETLEVRL